MRASALRLAAWLAAVAMVLQGLWPLLAHAQPAKSLLVPVCTVEGVTHYVELSGGKTPLEEQTAARHDHCVFCAFETGRVISAPAPTAVLLLQAASEAGVPELAAFPQAGLLHHPPAQPRAPPVSALL